MDKVKLWASAFWGALAMIFTPIAPVCVILITLNLLDYVSKIIALRIRHDKISSRKAMDGVWHKALMWIIVAAAICLDILIASAGNHTGIFDYSGAYYVSTMTAVWLCLNEVISIIENVSCMDGNVPPFVTTIAAWAKRQLEGDNEHNNTYTTTDSHKSP